MILKEVSRHSYLMYLIHGPLILFVIKPILAQMTDTPINSLVMIVLGCLYCAVVFLLAKGISPLLNALVTQPGSLAKSRSEL